jgi:hypothetical protein
MGQTKNNALFGGKVPGILGAAGQALTVNNSGDGLLYANVSGSGAGGGIKSDQSFVATAGQTVFNLNPSVSTGYTYIYRLGHLLDSSEYTLTPTTLTLANDANLNDPIRVLEFGSTNIISSPSGSGASVSVDVTQNSHGLSIGDVVYNNGTNYLKAQADDAATSEVMGWVSAVSDVNNFTLQSAGPLELTSHGYGTIGDALFLSEATAGLATVTEPGTGVSKPVGYILDTNNILVLIQRGADVDGSSTSWVFPETTHTGDDSTTAFDHSHIIGSESSIVVIVGGVIQSTTAYTVGNDGGAERKRVTLGFTPSTGTKIVIRSLGIPYNTPIATGDEPWQVVNSAHNAVDGQYLAVNPSSAFAITLPTTPSDNTKVVIGQGGGNLSTNNVTVNGGTKNIRTNVEADSTTDVLNTNFSGRVTYVFKTALDVWLTV